MATPDPNTLMESVACYACSQENVLLNGYKLGLLKAILLASDPTAMTDPNDLMESVACYACLTPAQMQMIELALLVQIANGGVGPHDVDQVMPYTTDPNGEGLVPGNPADGAIAYQKAGTGPTYGWNIALQLWN